MGKEVKIIIPDDCELIQTGVGKWEQRKMEKKLPKTWEEFCEMNPIKDGESVIHANSEIASLRDGYDCRQRDVYIDRSTLPNKETAEAFIALAQLIQLRNYYNGDWVPDWSHCAEKYSITSYFSNLYGEVRIGTSFSYHNPRVLTFRTEKLCDQFFENFEDLIEIAKPLI